VHRLQFHYTLTRDHRSALVRNPLIDLLQAVAANGSISAGAKALGLSYRHVWGELKRWENELGNELVVWEKGQSARLTEFGSKLMWAERQTQARLAPQIEALRADLERAYAVAFDPQAHVASLYASHDDALGVLREHALENQLHMDIHFCGSVDALRGLNEGRCVMAGFHTLQNPAPGTLAEQIYKPLLQPGLHKIIGFAHRTQGLIVAADNPLKLRSLQDLVTSQARFVNRTLGSGTRVVLDELLQQQGISSTHIRGYLHTEPSHTAVAHAVAAGEADAGLGIAIAAQALGLSFVPLVQESYYLVCLKSALEEPAIAALRQVLQGHEWKQKLAQTSGYSPHKCGDVLSLRAVLPWWSFTPRRAAYKDQNAS
jgi:putative molybdopterin biosynthesis protein